MASLNDFEGVNMKILAAAIVIIVIIFALIRPERSGKYIPDNYGQYDKGSALCDKGAYGDVNGLCN